MVLFNGSTYKNRQKSLIISILIALPLLFYFIILGHFQYNFPFYDDYNVVLKTVLDWQNTTSFLQKINNLFAQHNEHRLLIVRLLSLLDYWIRGQVVFTDLIWLGNLSLVVVFWVLYRCQMYDVRCVKKYDISYSIHLTSGILPPAFYFSLLTISLLLFQFQSWDNQFWAMASVQNFGIYAFVCLTIYYAVQQKPYLSLFFAAVCIGTSGSGLFIVPVILLLYFIQKQWRNLSISAIILSGLCVFYFYHYQSSAQNGSVTDRLLHGNWLEMAIFLGAFLGNNLYHPALPFVAPVVGWLGTGWVLYLFFKKYYKINPTLFYILVFILLTALAAALLRSSRGIEGAYPSRYRITSSLFLATIFLTMMQVLKSRTKAWVLGLGLMGSLALYLLSIYVYFPRIRNNQELRMADAWFFENGYNIAGHFDSAFATDILKKSDTVFGLQIQSSTVRDYKSRLTTAVEASHSIPFDNFSKTGKGKFKPKPTLNAYKVQNHVNVGRSIEYGIDWVSHSKSAIKGWVRFLKPVTSQKIYVVVDGTIYETLFFKRYDLVAQKKSAAYQDTGFLAILPHTVDISKQNWYLIATNNRGEQVQIDNE